MAINEIDLPYFLDDGVKTKVFTDEYGNVQPKNIKGEKQMIGLSQPILQTNFTPTENSTMVIKKYISKLSSQVDTVKSFVETVGTITQDNQFTFNRLSGEINLHESQKGKYITLEYQAKGLQLFGANKIYTKYSSDGLVTETLEQLISRSYSALEGVITIAELNQKLEQWKQDIRNITNLTSTLNESATNGLVAKKEIDITLAKIPQAKIDIVKVDTDLKASLDAGVVTSNIITSDLTNKLNDGQIKANKVSGDVATALLQANDAINTITSTGNKTETITTAMWGNIDTVTKLYKYRYTHTLNSQSIIIQGKYLDGHSWSNDYQYIDNRTIDFYNDTNDTIIITLADKNYGGIRRDLSDYNTEHITETVNKQYYKAEDKAKVVKLENDVIKTNEQLADKVRKYEDNVANVEFYRFLVNNIGLPNEDWIPAIKQCLDIYNNVYIPHDIKIGSPIFLKTGQKLKGFNRNTEIKVNSEFIGICIIGITTTNEIDFQIEKIRLNGDMYNHSKTFKGMYLNNANQGKDSHIRVNDVFIEEVPGDAFYLTGRGENFISDIVTRNNRGHGFYIYVADSWFNNLSSGINTGNGFEIRGANNRFFNCKAWFSNVGYLLGAVSARTEMVGCEAQDNVIGYQIASTDNIIVGAVIEASGIDTINVNYPYGYKENQPAIKFMVEAKNNHIQCTITDRKDFIPEGTVDYILDLDGTLNKVDCTFKQLRKDIVFDKSRLYSNILSIHGTDINNNIKYFYYNKQLNLYESSDDTFNNILKTPTIYDSNCVILEGGYSIKNGVCYINLEIKALKNYDFANILLHGFPKPIANSPLNLYTDQKKSLLNIRGELVVGNTIINNEVYSISGSYLIKSK